MARKKKNKNIESAPKKRKEKYAPSNPIVKERDVIAVLKAPVNPQINRSSETIDRIQIVNGVVCATSRYSRLFEDYDDS